MKNARRILSLLLTLSLLLLSFSVLTACKDDKDGTEDGMPPAYSRVDKDGNASANGKYIKYGSYPQSEVADATLKDVLNAKAGELPTDADDKAWTSYKYYMDDSNENDFMWYMDIEHDGERYRGVYFTQYRPHHSGASNSSPYYDKDRYSVNAVHWFKYEPIIWRILTESDGRAFLLCETAIDAQEFQSCYVGVGEEDKREYGILGADGQLLRDANGALILGNNYEYSSIRRWLNDNFYNTAFNSDEKNGIILTNVDNSLAATGDESNEYVCNNTSDYIFLPSKTELTSTEYGFSANSEECTERARGCSDYSVCMGATRVTEELVEGDSSIKPELLGNAMWWMRTSLANTYDDLPGAVDINGMIGNFYNISTMVSVCPAMWIKL